MTDVWDIAQYVEAHPDNHKQRWRLAKKLYMAWEYRLALEHLQVLKNEVGLKINVTRYLAATYFRLSRYDEAVRELEAAIEEWPDELGLAEQLARTLDVAGKKEAAADVWEKIAEREPNHPFAKRAVEHLRKTLGLQPAPSEAQHQPLPLMPGGIAERSCQHCGAMNNPEFARCWQCHSSLQGQEEAQEELSSVAALIKESETSPWALVSNLAIVALLALGVFLTLRAFDAAQTVTAAAELPGNLFEFLSSALLMTKLILGLTALVTWPVLWWVSATFVGLDKVHNEVLYRCGALLAGVTYAASWLPESVAYLVIVIPLVLSAALAFGAIGAPAKRAALLWAVQGVAMLLVVLTLLAGRHGLGLITEFPAMLRFASSEGDSTIEREAWTPLDLRVHWESSGSDWLDENAAAISISIETGAHSKPMFLELRTGDETVVFREFNATSFNMEYSPIEPGKVYRLRLQGEEGIDTTVKLSGLLHVAPALPE